MENIFAKSFEIERVASLGTPGSRTMRLSWARARTWTGTRACFFTCFRLQRWEPTIETVDLSRTLTFERFCQTSMTVARPELWTSVSALWLKKQTYASAWSLNARHHHLQLLGEATTARGLLMHRGRMSTSTVTATSTDDVIRHDLTLIRNRILSGQIG